MKKFIIPKLNTLKEAAMDSTKAPLVTLQGISKSFGATRVLKDISLDIFPGEILALVGENGAGKSTLMKILTGLYPTGSFQGEFFFDSKPCELKSLDHARQVGINMVFQELSLVPTLNLIENIFLGAEISGCFGMIDWAAESTLVTNLLERLSMTGFFSAKSTLNPIENALYAPIKNLGIGQKQLLECAKALWKKTRLLILDEPTTALSPQEANLLLENITQLKQENVAIVYISHRLHEIMTLTDRIAILRDGAIVAEGLTSSFTEDSMISHMVGRPLTQRYPPAIPPSMAINKSLVPLLRVKDLVLDTRHHSQSEFNSDIPSLGSFLSPPFSFDLTAGEILGVAGLMGSGRTELAQSLFGLRRNKAGQIFIEGQKVHIKTPAEAVKHQMALVPEDRKKQGLVLNHTIAENLSLVHLSRFTRAGIIQQEALRQKTLSVMKALQVKPFIPSLPVKNLSGGNQQKICLGKWLIYPPKILILDEPTRGVDVGAKFDIYQQIRELAATGVGILMISSDMEEILGMSDRILVLRRGTLSGIVSRSDATAEKILALAVKEPLPSKPQKPTYADNTTSANF